MGSQFAVPLIWRIAMVAVIGGAIGAGLARAGQPEKWIATSTASIAVTGDIVVTDAALVFGDGKRLDWTPIGERRSVWTVLGDDVAGKIYKISPPSDPELLNGNTLCGWQVSYIVLSQRSPRSLAVTVFHSAAEPDRFGDESCAVYFYEK